MMIDLTKQKFGRLVVLRTDGSDKWYDSFWLCKCDCGKEAVVRGGNLRNGHTQSCGCLQSEKATKHGHSSIRTPTYRSWQSMKNRCLNSKYHLYKDYGGRGITVCERWMKFENFLEDMSEAPTGYQIDRINNSGNYCKPNCRWVTPKQNCRNRRSNRLIVFRGKTQCLADWAEELNIKYTTLWSRLYKHGWSVEKTMTTTY